MAPAATPPALQQSIHASTTTWQTNLRSLFQLAKDRFPDVVWELINDDDDDNDNLNEPEEVWGHKAIVYARAPPSFQARYFSFRPAPIGTPIPSELASANGTLNGQSALSLSLGPDFQELSHSISPYRAGSPSPSTNTTATSPGTILRLPTSINPTLFSNELEYLYTGKGFGAAFEFLFDTSESREEGDAEENRIDKLRKDLVFMWRSRLYSDIRIALTGNFSSTNHESATAIFSSHRFILVSRSPYFYSQLIAYPSKPTSDGPLTLTLPSPPFTPASLHFTLGYIYTGTLVFSHRGYDLDTGFHIMRSATYLALDALYDEIQARIVQEMMHGLFHAFLEFTEYERITGGKWGTGGCRCRQCARRAPRTLEFAISEDVKNPHLERGARRALVGLFGEGWCTIEFATLPQKTRDSLLKGLSKRTTPLNIFALIFAAQHAMDKLNAVIDAWADTAREMILSARKVIDEVLCVRSEECFEREEWVEILEGDGVGFDDAEKVKWVMESVRRGLNERCAGMVYQIIVSSILLRPHATETDATMLSSTSTIRVLVEELRMDILRWLRKRWVGVRQEGGFNALEGWAVKEISGEIEVPVEDLISPHSPATTHKALPATTNTTTTPSRRTGPAGATLSKVDPDADSVSLRASVLSRNTMKRSVTPSQKEREQNLSLNTGLGSAALSVRSDVLGTTRSVNPSLSPSVTPTQESKRPDVPSGPRPDSKLTPSSASIASAARSTATGSSDPTTPTKTNLLPKTLITKVTPRTPTGTPGGSRTPSVISTTTRPKSSVTSVRSKTPTARKLSGGSTTLRPPLAGGASRPTSSMSTMSDASTTFKTAFSDSGRRTSTASTISNSSNKTQGPSMGKVTISRPRVPSTASVTSMTPKAKRPSSTATTRTNTPESAKLAPAVAKRSPSMASVKSNISATSSIAPSPPKKPVVGRKVAAEKKTALSSANKNNDPPPSPASTVKGKSKAAAIEEDDIPPGKVSSESNSTVRTVKRKESSDTIKMVVDDKPQPAQQQHQQAAPPVFVDGLLDISPRGATLEIGIPCIISSKRKRFRAFARYIGEVEGELGPWVGVEVPVGESWVGDKLEGRQWNDGSWGGVRYFDIGACGSEWDDGDNDRAVRRRKLDIMNGSVKGLKREGDQLNVDRAKRLRSASPAISDASNSESRGLFVRPQQVLYVVDAVGTDL